jgi:pSer/pThr/pTyr-binding forkhead associated (FHA) protein
MAPLRPPLGPHSASPIDLQHQLEADRRGVPYLLFSDADGAQRILALNETLRSASIGRGPNCDVSLSWDHQASRAHAQLERVGDDWTVVDDGLSRNGTFVNGQRLTGRRRLRDGDVLGIGLSAIAFRAPVAGLDSTASSEAIRRPSLTEAQRRVLVALCRPYREGFAHAIPATNRQMANELFLSVETIRTHIRALFERFEVEDLPQHRKRARLVELAFKAGAVIPRDLEH